jgi:hypothetical protein
VGNAWLGPLLCLAVMLVAAAIAYQVRARAKARMLTIHQLTNPLL